MHELRFRFWDKAFKVMRNVDTINLSGNMAICFTQSAVGERSCSLDTLMQYTGYCDEHGSEIYEGDILKITTPFDYVQYTKVYRDSGGLCIDYSCDDYSFGLIGWVFDWIEADEGVLEIIGNTHANPDLWSEIQKEL